MPILRRIVAEVQHYLTQLDKYGLVPASTRRFLLDEDIPSPKLLLVPELALTDFFKLLENPTPSAVDYWIRKGERSVWPAVSALNVRCGIEIAIDRGHETVKRRSGGTVASNGHQSIPQQDHLAEE
jgi:TAG lipase/lysophosphatidylethanolamine acyltransferase